MRRPDRGRHDGWQPSNLRELQLWWLGYFFGQRDWGGVAEHQVRHRLRVQPGDQARGNILGRRADSVRQQELEREGVGRLHLRRRRISHVNSQRVPGHVARGEHVRLRRALHGQGHASERGGLVFIKRAFRVR